MSCQDVRGETAVAAGQVRLAMAGLRVVHPAVRRDRVPARRRPRAFLALLDAISEDGELVATPDIPGPRAFRFIYRKPHLRGRGGCKRTANCCPVRQHIAEQTLRGRRRPSWRARLPSAPAPLPVHASGARARRMPGRAGSPPAASVRRVPVFARVRIAARCGSRPG